MKKLLNLIGVYTRSDLYNSNYKVFGNAMSVIENILPYNEKNISYKYEDVEIPFEMFYGAIMFGDVYEIYEYYFKPFKK